MTGGRSFASALGRLRRMSPTELAYRLRSEAIVRWEKVLYRVGTNPAGRIDPAAGPDTRPFFFDPSQRDTLVGWLEHERPEWIERARARADDILRDPALERPRWTTAPGCDEPWPDRFYADIDIFGGDQGRGDVRLIWELSRHAELVHLAKASFVTKDPSYGRRAIELWEGWLRDNPYGRGVNWASALEIAMRAVAWTWCYHFISDAFDGERWRRLTRALHEHGVYLERHLSVYFSSNNHVVGEALGLQMIGATFHTLPRAARWERLGWSMLREELGRQYYPDGGSTEQATSYHHYSLGLFVQAALLRRLAQRPVEPEYWERLERAFHFSMCITRPDGRVPMIGDNDDAVACPAGEGPGWDFRHYQALGAALFERGDLRRASGAYSELAFWLLGPKGAETFERLEPSTPAATSVCFPDTGYCIMRSGWDDRAHYLCFDVGPLAGGLLPDGTPSAAHGHADALSVEAVVSGEPIVSDPGIHSYNSELDLLRYFRTTGSHATLSVNERSQSEFAGRLKWSRAARTQLEIWSPARPFDYAQASHDGYEHGDRPVRHRRGVLFLHGWGWVIWDHLAGSGRHTVDVNLPLAPGVEVERLERGLYAGRGSDGLQLELTGAGAAAFDVVRGASDPPRGWVAPSYGRREPAHHARMRFEVDAPASLWQVARPVRGRQGELELAASAGEGLDGLVIRAADLAARLFVSTSPEPGRLGQVETDASLVWLQTQPDGGRIRGVALRGSYVRWDGEEVWRGDGAAERSEFEMNGPAAVSVAAR